MRIAVGLALGIVAATGRGRAQEPAPTPDPAGDASVYPLSVGARWVYASNLERDLTFEATEAAEVGGLPCIVVKASMDGKVTQEERISAGAERVVVVSRVNQGNEFELDPPQVTLQFPLAKGKTWTWSGMIRQKAGEAELELKTRATVEDAETVVVPAGTFRAWRVRIESDSQGSHATALKWYSPGVGLVQEKTVMTGQKGETKIETKLKEFKLGGQAPPEK